MDNATPAEASRILRQTKPLSDEERAGKGKIFRQTALDMYEGCQKRVQEKIVV